MRARDPKRDAIRPPQARSVRRTGQKAYPKQAFAASQVENPTWLHASVDGVNIPITAANRGLAPFSYRAPNTDNLLQFFGEDVPGPRWPYGNTPIGVVVAPAASDGYWLEINPLGPGVHTVNFGATNSNGTFSLDVTYTITVN
jgi:hypothetical protein